MVSSFEVVENLHRWKSGRAPRLLKVELWPTERCNLACQFCGTRGRDYSTLGENEMSDGDLRCIVDDSLELGAQQFVFSGGGEPWLRRKVLLELMAKITAAGSNGLVHTNGTLMSKGDIKEIVKMNWGSVILSLDGPTEEIHDFLRCKPGSFKKVMKVIKTFRTLRKKKRSEKPMVGLNCLVTNRLVPHIVDMVRLASDVGCDEILFQALMPDTNESRELVLTSEEQAAFITSVAEATEVAHTLGIRTNIGEFSSQTILEESREAHKILAEQKDDAKDNPDAIPCFEPWRGIFVTSEGKISLCPQFAKLKSSEGKRESSTDAWRGKDSESVRQQIASGKVSGICKECCTNRLFENKKIREAYERDQ